MAKRRAEVEVTLRDRASSGLRRLGSTFGGITKAIGLAVTAAAALGTVLGGRFLLGAIRSAGEFDEAMSRVQAVTGASADELGRLRQAADEAGASTRFTATEAANGLEELARAGQNANEAIQTLNPVLDLAAGNNQTVAESAIQVTTALNAFGLAAEDAGRVSDVYTRAAQRSAQTTGQLAEAMTTVAPVARQAGLSIEETAAVLGNLANQGFRGSLGGTAFRNALLALDDPASKFRQELEKLGITSTNFLEVLSELENTSGDTGAAFRALGVRAIAPVRSLDGLSGGLRDLITELEGASGASREAAGIMADNLPGALRGLSSAFDAARRRLVEPLVDKITEDVQEFTGKLQEFVQGDTLGNLRDLLTDTFDTARQAVTEFIAGVDFAEVQQRIADFVGAARDRLGEFRESVDSLARGWNIVVGSTQVAVGTVRTAFNGLGVIITGAVKLATDGLTQLVRFLNFTSFGTVDFLKTLEEEMRFASESFAETLDNFKRDTGDATQQVVDGFARLGESGQEAGRRVRDGTDEATAGLRELDDQARTSEDNLGALQQALLESGLSFEQLGLTAEEAGELVAEGADKTRDAGEAAAEAKGDIDALGESAEVSASGIGRLGEELDGTGNELDETGDSARETSRSFDDLRQSIQSIETPAALAQLRREVQGLAQSGALSEEQVRRLNVELTNQTRRFAEQAARARDGGRATREFANSQRDAAGAANELSRGLEQTGQRAGRAGPLVELTSEALAKFREEVSQIRVVNPAGYMQQYSAALNRAVEASERQTDAEARKQQQLERSERTSDRYISTLEALRRANDLYVGTAAPGIDEIRSANERLREELARLRGEEQALSDQRERNARQDIELQVQAAQTAGDFERVEALKQQLTLLDQVAKERKAQAAQDAEALERAEGINDASARQSSALRDSAGDLERAANALGSARVTQDINVNFRRDQGEQLILSEQQLSQLANRILDIIQFDGDRT